MVAEVTVKCGTPQHSEMFSWHLRVNHAQLFAIAVNWGSACLNILLLYFKCRGGGVKQSYTLALFYFVYLLPKDF